MPDEKLKIMNIEFFNRLCVCECESESLRSFSGFIQENRLWLFFCHFSGNREKKPGVLNSEITEIVKTVA